MSKRPLELNKEYPSLLEPIEREIMLFQLRRDVRHAFQDGKGPANREVHAKLHGCVRAQFVVKDNLPPECRYGVFKEPRAFTAWIRFSSALPSLKDDIVPDHRGMAIKLIGVEGKKLIPGEQSEKNLDFVLVNEPIFITRTLVQYFQLFAMRSMRRITTIQASDIIMGGPVDKLTREAQPLVISSPLETSYFSQTPYLLGKRAIKFKARPDIAQMSPIPDPPRPDFLREALSKHLASQSARFFFEVQFQENPYRQPIEDAGVEWTTPFITVATIEIPPQRFESAAQMAFGQNLSFNPWRTLSEHRPLGTINRSRLGIYQNITKLRHELNGILRTEPTGDEVFEAE